jgi:hypothetical protein
LASSFLPDTTTPRDSIRKTFAGGKAGNSRMDKRLTAGGGGGIVINALLASVPNNAAASPEE